MKRLSCLGVFLLLFLAGCFAMPVEAPALPPLVFTPPEPRELITEPVMRGDVRIVTRPVAHYRFVNEIDIHFEEGGIPVARILVGRGDFVQEGDLLIELGIEGLDEEHRELVDTHTRLNRSLAQVTERHNLALNLAETSGIPVDDAHYIELRADILAEIAVINRQLDALQIQYGTQFIYAPMSGMVTSDVRHFDGMRTTAGSLAVTIADPNYAFFVLRAPEAAALLPGERLEMELGNDVFTVEVVDLEALGLEIREEWAGAAVLDFVGPRPIITAGSGVLTFLIAESLDTLYIPQTFLHQVGERVFVFVYEDGLRVLRDVVAGIRPAGIVEIVSGLEEGELVTQ